MRSCCLLAKMGRCLALLVVLYTLVYTSCFASPFFIKAPRLGRRPKYSPDTTKALVDSSVNDKIAMSISTSVRQDYRDNDSYYRFGTVSKPTSLRSSLISHLKHLLLLNEAALRHKLRYIVAKEQAIVVDCESAAHQMSILRNKERLIRESLRLLGVGRLKRKPSQLMDYPKFCTCKLVPSHRNSACYYFTHKADHYCRKRTCKGKYVCMHAVRKKYKNGIICMMRKSSTKIVPKGDGKCKIKKYETVFYTPYTYNS